MPDLFFEKHVPHLPERMFDLVNDLERYPQFLPNVSAMTVTRDRGDGDNVRLARMTIRFGPVTQAYTSRVVADPEKRTIEAKAMRPTCASGSSSTTGRGTSVAAVSNFRASRSRFVV